MTDPSPEPRVRFPRWRTAFPHCLALLLATVVLLAVRAATTEESVGLHERAGQTIFSNLAGMFTMGFRL